jgi:hypothetical protein
LTPTLTPTGAPFWKLGLRFQIGVRWYRLGCSGPGLSRSAEGARSVRAGPFSFSRALHKPHPRA